MNIFLWGLVRIYYEAFWDSAIEGCVYPGVMLQMNLRDDGIKDVLI